MTAEREMTLHEWVGKLPEIHRANREFLALQARIAELETGIRKHKEFFSIDTSYTQEDLELWALLPGGGE